MPASALRMSGRPQSIFAVDHVVSAGCRTVGKAYSCADMSRIFNQQAFEIEHISNQHAKKYRAVFAVVPFV